MVSGATVMFGPLTAVGRGWYGMSPFIGVGVGIAMIVGLLISYGVLLPMRTWGTAVADKDPADCTLDQVDRATAYDLAEVLADE